MDKALKTGFKSYYLTRIPVPVLKFPCTSFLVDISGNLRYQGNLSTRNEIAVGSGCRVLKGFCLKLQRAQSLAAHNPPLHHLLWPSQPPQLLYPDFPFHYFMLLFPLAVEQGGRNYFPATT